MFSLLILLLAVSAPLLLLAVSAPLLLLRPPNSHRRDAVLIAARHSYQDV